MNVFRRLLALLIVIGGCLAFFSPASLRRRPSLAEHARAFFGGHRLRPSARPLACCDSDRYCYENDGSPARNVISRRNLLVLSGSSAATVANIARASTGSFSNGTVSEDAANPTAKTESDGKLLTSSSWYRVQSGSPGTNPTFRNLSKRPSAGPVALEAFLNALRSTRAVFLGERHPERRDHALQAALIRTLHAATAHRDRHLAVGLEAVQRPFQPVLDRYRAGSISDDELVRATEWESRWYWSFEAYREIFHTCRELNIPMLALDVATEDRVLVENKGLNALAPQRYAEYVPDTGGFATFGNTTAYRAFVNATLRPPYQLQRQTLPFSNFVERQMLRDESMASVAAEWLAKTPGGLFLGCIGINHATFSCGVPGRLERLLDRVGTFPSETNDRSSKAVVSVLINPEPLNTGTELKVCRARGRPPVNNDDDDSATRIFVPNIQNQVCIENGVEVQNYALQLEYDAPHPQEQGRCALPLSDYLVFSPKEAD